MKDNETLFELVSSALEQILDDLNCVELSDRGSMVLSKEYRRLNNLHKELQSKVGDTLC
jgi:rRNA pseudouridine-1189 N-methylase Emg1 (Nep1/Mra1 family)